MVLRRRVLEYMSKPTLFDTPDKIDNLIHAYHEGLSTKTLATQYGVSQSCVLRTLTRHGVNIRVHNKLHAVNHAFFEVIDTEAKAYFLGLLMADGCVTHGRERTQQIVISLQGGDKHILEDFIKAIEFSGPIYSYVRGANKGGGFGKEPRLCCSVRISSSRLCKDLMRHGCTPKKSLTLAWPKLGVIPDHLMHHFIRGYMDGDGWMCWRKPWREGKPWVLVIGFCGNEEFIVGLRGYLMHRIGLRGPKPHLYHGIARIDVSAVSEAVALRDYLYKGATIALERKRVNAFLPAFREHRHQANTESPNSPDILPGDVDVKPS